MPRNEPEASTQRFHKRGEVMKLKFIGLVIVMSIMGSESGHAQFGDSFPIWFNLKDADIVAMDGAADRILANKTLKPGMSESWKGKGTGNTGKISILKAFKKYGLPCFETSYQFEFFRVADPVKYVIPWCRLSDNSWKMVF